MLNWCSSNKWCHLIFCPLIWVMLFANQLKWVFYYETLLFWLMLLANLLLWSIRSAILNDAIFKSAILNVLFWSMLFWLLLFQKAPIFGVYPKTLTFKKHWNQIFNSDFYLMFINSSKFMKYTMLHVQKLCHNLTLSV